MLDDEIVFLGSSSGKQSSCTQYPQVPHRPVTGIILHVEKQNAPATGCLLLFRRVDTSFVHIGRRSGLEAGTTHTRSCDHEPDSAMFRCAVVSRKHARITFSDSGHAYLIDLASHHGTFVRKPGEKFSKMIKPETSTLLSDGDIVTFGKSVGKGEETVMPIVARIELLYSENNSGASKPPSTPFRPLVVPSFPSPPFTPDRHSLKIGTSGRYGIHTSSSSASSSSDESYSSHSPIVYSDIEEIPNPKLATSSSKEKPGLDEPAVDDNQRDNFKESSSNNNTNTSQPGSLGQALNVLRRFLPPAQPPLSQVSSFFFRPESSKPPSAAPSVVCLSDVVHPQSSVSLNNERPSENPSSVASAASDFNPDESRSSSPMDLGSPSSAPEDDNDNDLENLPPASTSVTAVSNPPNYTLSLVGRVPGPTLAPIALQPDDSETVHLPAPTVIIGGSVTERMSIALVNSPEGVGSSGGRSPIEYRYTSPPLPSIIPPPPFMYPFYPEAPIPVHPPPHGDDLNFNLNPLPAPIPDRMKDVEGSIESLKAEVTKLHAHRRKYKARFNSNVQVISEKLSQFDDRLLEVNAEYIVLSNQVERIQEVDISDMNSHLEVLQDNMDEAADEREDAGLELAEASKEREEMKTKLAELGEAVAEMKSFRDQMKKELDEQLVQMKSLHATTLATLATQETQHQQTQALLRQCQETQASLLLKATAARLVSAASQTPVPTSLKRKRDDTDENGEEVENENSESNDESVKVGDIEMNDEPIVTTTTTTGDTSSDVVVLVVDDLRDTAPMTDMDKEMGAAHDATIHISDAPPPRKRARRFARVVAQTATAVTVGAVVTWSALAFS